MNQEKAIQEAKECRKETIRELGYLIKDLQNDLDRLTQEQDSEHDGLTPQLGNVGFYLKQHCLRYEQTIKAGARMEEWASIANWIASTTKEGN